MELTVYRKITKQVIFSGMKEAIHKAWKQNAFGCRRAKGIEKNPNGDT